MPGLTTLAQSLGLSVAAGINLPATVAVLGVAERSGWIAPLPGALGAVSSIWVIAIASVIYVMEFLVTLIPGVASAWETVQSIVRPPAAAVLAVATTYHMSPPVVVAAGLLGGGLALTTHGTKLGLRYAVDTSPEPVTNLFANVAEFATLSSIAVFVWSHPFLTLSVAICILILLILVVRRIIKTLRYILSGNWKSRAPA